MTQNQNEKNQFQPVPSVRSVEPARTPEDYYVTPGTVPGQQRWQGQQPLEGRPVQPKQQMALPSRFPIETLTTRSLWTAHPQEVPPPPLQTSPSPSVERVAATPRWKPRPPRRSSWKNKRRLGLIAALSLIVVCCLVSFAAWHVDASSVPDVTLYRVSMKHVDLPIGGGGISYPVQRLDISYPFTALVPSVFVKPGDKVSLNQPLVRIDLSQVNSQNVDKLGLPPKGDAPAMPNGDIDSTISGTVTTVNVFPGQLFPANKVMLTIYDESNIVVHAKFPVAAYGQIRVNQKAQVMLSALPNINFNGTVTSIILSADSQSATFEVWVTVPNTSGQLLAGMNIYVQIQVPVLGLVLPRLAVLNPDQDSIVFLAHQQHVYIQPVQVLAYTGDTLIIGSGLQVNDLVVLVGLDSLVNGQAVRITGIED